jgi:hypothetical protein
VVTYGSVRLAAAATRSFPDSANVTWLLLGTYAALCTAALAIPVVFARRARADRQAGHAGDIGVRALLYLLGYTPLLLLLVGILLRP